MNLDKKGQLTIFVIISLVVVVGLVTYFIMTGDLSKTIYDEEVKTLKENIEGCILDSYRNDLNIVAFQGGYLSVPEPKEIKSGNWIEYSIPYYYHEGELYYPDIKTIESEIELLSKDSLKDCLAYFKSSEGFERVEFTEPSLEVSINKNGVIYQNIFSLTAEYNNKTVIVDFSKDEMTLDSNIYDIYNLATFIASYLDENNEWMPYTDIVMMAREANVYVSITDSEDGMENSIKIINVEPTAVPVQFNFNNKLSHNDLSDVEPLL